MNAFPAVLSAAGLLALVLITAGPSFGWFELSTHAHAALNAGKLAAAIGLFFSLARQFGLQARWTVPTLVIAALLVGGALIWLTGSSDPPLPPAEQLYTENCGACHGAFGQGTEVGPALNDPVWLHGEGSLADIHRVVDEGVTGTSMVSWKDILSDEDRLAVSIYVFGFQLAEQ